MLPRWTRRPVAWVSRTRVFRRVAPSAMPQLERLVSALTGGRLVSSVLVVPSLVLHTVGARSGLARSTRLIFCPEPDGRMLITGSNFGGAQHQAWTGNLLAHPEAAVTVDGRRFPVRAELVPPQEREQVWVELERNWPGYRDYERVSGRTLRIFRLSPR